MKFCPECGTMLVPQSKENEKLTCSECGKEEVLGSEKEYRFEEKKKDRKAPGVPVVEEEKKKVEVPDYDIDTDVREEVFKETY